MKKRFIVRKSSIHGKGVFATQDFKKGENIFILKGDKKFLNIKNKKDSALGPNWIGIKHGVWIDPAAPFYYLNHSCDPNMGIKGTVMFTAIKKIKLGDELTFDYSITEDDIHWKFNCHCGKKNCRKILKSIQYLPQVSYQSYFPYIPKYFQNVYNKSYNK